MEHRDIYEQPHKQGKKIFTAATSIVLVGAIIVAGTVSKLKSSKNASVPTTTKPDTTMVSPDSTELVLTEDFDINNPDAVAKRAQDIYNLSEKKISVFDIKNSIYALNDMYDKITYPDAAKTDDQKYEYLKQLSLVLGSILDDYLADYVVTMDQMVNEKIGNPTFVGTTNPVPCAYMWMDKDSEAKRFAIEIAKVYYEQRANIRNGNVAVMTITANDYYNLFNKWKSMDLSVADNVIILYQFYTINSIFTPFLDKEQSKDLDNISGYLWKYSGMLYSEISISNKLNVSPEKQNDLKNGNSCNDAAKLLEKRRKEDIEAAKKRVEESNKLIATETGVVNQGGTPASGSAGKQEVVNSNVTTRVDTSEFIVSIPNEGTSVDNVSGGNVVEEHTTNQTVPSTTQPETTTYVDDEDIPVMDDKEFFGKATDDDIKNYVKTKK